MVKRLNSLSRLTFVSITIDRVTSVRSSRKAQVVELEKALSEVRAETGAQANDCW